VHAACKYDPWFIAEIAGIVAIYMRSLLAPPVTLATVALAYVVSLGGMTARTAS
jgi:hypothetical protein